MKIRYDSWHARLIRRFDLRPKTLCGYFWALMFSLFVSMLLIVLSPLVFGVLLLGAMVEGMSRVWQWATRRFGDRVVVAKPDSLLVAYLKAKKAKVCPFIEWV